MSRSASSSKRSSGRKISSELFRSEAEGATLEDAMQVDEEAEVDSTLPPVLDETHSTTAMRTSVEGDGSNLTPIIDESVVSENLPSSSSKSQKSGPSSTAQGGDLPNDSNLVASLPVYFSTSMPSTSSLQIFQYPTYQRGVPLPIPESARSRGLREAMRYRSRAKRVEVELPLDLRKEVYNKDRGEDMAKGANVGGSIGGGTASSKVKKEHGTEESRGGSKRLERTRLESTLIPHQTQYLVGVIRDKALHLTPVESIVQLRPSMHYLDVLDALAQQEKRRAQTVPGEETDEGSMTEDGSKAVKEKKKAQSLSVSVRESTGASGAGRAKGGVADSRDTLMQAEREADAEWWVDLDWKDEKSDEARKLFDSQLFATSRIPLECKTRPREFLQ